MGHKTITLDLPNEDYDVLEKMAQAINLSIEEVIAQSVNFWVNLPPITGELEPIFKAMEACTDIQLVALVYRHLSPAESARLHELNDKIEFETITDEEYAELEQLIVLVDRHTLIRSQAVLLLHQHGYDVERILKARA